MGAPTGIDFPAPDVDGECRVDPAKPLMNVNPETDRLEVSEASNKS